MTNTYWTSNGRYQEQYEALFGELVPGDGNCETLNGEILRALGKVYYEYYNNGMGNNITGPCLFIKAKAWSAMTEVVRCAWNDIYELSNVYGIGAKLDTQLEVLADFVMEYIINTPNQPNTEDMWDLQEEDDVHCIWGDDDDAYED